MRRGTKQKDDPRSGWRAVRGVLEVVQGGLAPITNAGHNYVGHDRVGHNYVGHNRVGHNYVGHDRVGHNSIKKKVSRCDHDGLAFALYR